MKNNAAFDSRCRISMASPLAACVFILLAAATMAGAAASTSLAPHRAVYDLSLESKHARSPITSVRGRMVHEFDGAACEGYTVNMRWVAVMAGEEGEQNVDDVRFASWEDGKGEAYTYTSIRYLDDKLVEEVKAHAMKGGPLGSGTVSLSKPSEETIDLPPRTIFPTTHLKHVIDTAASGQQITEDQVYDVSEDGRQIYSTLAVVGTRRTGEAGLEGVVNADSLTRLPAWRVTISYFKGSDEHGEQTPAFEQTFDLFANGVASNLLLDYGDIVIKGTLRNLEFLTLPECAN